MLVVFVVLSVCVGVVVVLCVCCCCWIACVFGGVADGVFVLVVCVAAGCVNSCRCACCYCCWLCLLCCL